LKVACAGFSKSFIQKRNQETGSELLFKGGYRAIERVATADASARLYRVDKGDPGELWIAWLDAGKLWLPGDVVPARELEFEVGTTAATATLERLVTSTKKSEPETETVAVRAGRIKLKLTPTPVFISLAR
jgi:hypothetical protein